MDLLLLLGRGWLILLNVFNLFLGLYIIGLDYFSESLVGAIFTCLLSWLSYFILLIFVFIKLKLVKSTGYSNNTELLIFGAQLINTIFIYLGFSDASQL